MLAVARNHRLTLPPAGPIATASRTAASALSATMPPSLAIATIAKA